MTKNVFLLLFALGAIGGAVLSWLQHEELVRLRAQLGDPNEGPLLRNHVAELEQQKSDLQRQIAAFAQLTRVAPRPPAAPAARNKPADAASSGPARGTPIFRLDGPKLDAVIAYRYSALLNRLNLPAAEADQLKKLLTERQQSTMDAVNAGTQQGLDLPALRQAVAAAQADLDTQIGALLGDAAYAQYQQYTQTTPQRNTIGQFQSILAETPVPLTADQTSQLIQILAQTQLPDDGGNVARLVYGGMDFHSRISDQTISAAAALLSPPQLLVLQKLQQQQGPSPATPTPSSLVQQLQLPGSSGP
jgi:hypothetical protein